MIKSKKMKQNIKYLFAPGSIAVIGASHNPAKIGYAITRNFKEGGYWGKVYPINPNVQQILGLKCYASVKDVKGSVDCAIICVPAKFVANVLRECAAKGVKAAIVISGGFSEVGNVEGEKELMKIAEENNMALIGPNCLGVLNPASKVDSLFLPIYKLERPRVGTIGFISQSGAVGGCIIDMAGRAGIGISKFISYGNAAGIDEADLLEYLGSDRNTKVIVCYIEGVKEGRNFMKIAKEVAKRKPVIVLKAGVSKKGAEAAKSHTGSLAGDTQAYRAMFKQCHLIEAQTLMRLFYFAKIFYQPLPKGKRVGIVTNGGGSGVLATDALEYSHLDLAQPSEETIKALKDKLPTYVNVRNPLDIIGDANSARYALAVDAMMRDPNIDILVVIVLFQTVALDSTVVDVLIRASETYGKPLVVVSTGGEYTEAQKRILDSYNIPTYHSPNAAMDSIAKAVEYAEFQRKRNLR
ncbi:MAG: CoA-binding protein [Candidatus Micrarchaeota archaeon]